MGRLERKLDDDAISRAQLKLGRAEPQTTRRTKPCRAGSTYRGDRRNTALGRYVGTPDRNGRSMRQMWPGVPVRYLPYKIKAPRRELVRGPDGQAQVVLVERKQPKVYRRAAA